MLIAFTGKKQSGKTTATKYVLPKLKAYPINFKDALLKDIKDKFPDLLAEIEKHYDSSDYDGWGWTVDRLFQEKPPLIRALFQNYGTNVRRADREDFWVYKWKEDVVPLLQAERKVVTDDVRFLNEAQAIKDLGGIIIRIERTDLESTDTHQSETEMDQITPDHTISVKTGELDKLKQELDRILELPAQPKPNIRLHVAEDSACEACE